MNLSSYNFCGSGGIRIPNLAYSNNMFQQALSFELPTLKKLMESNFYHIYLV